MKNNFYGDHNSILMHAALSHLGVKNKYFSSALLLAKTYLISKKKYSTYISLRKI